MSPTHQAFPSHTVVTDLTICTSISPAACNLDPQIWHCIDKDLRQYASRDRAWLCAALAKEEELTAEDLTVTNVSVGKSLLDTGSSHSWESRPSGIWILRSKFSGNIDQVVTAVDVLFGVDAVDPRPGWTLTQSSLKLNGHPKTPIPRLSILHGRTNPRLYDRPALRVREDGTFKIVQISDTHMDTGVGICTDAVDAEGKDLPDSNADPLTVDFISEVLDIEKPDLVVLTGDQLTHRTLDSQSALFKVVAPIIERAIPFAAVFGVYDSEGIHALSRTAQMSILQSLPFSLCEPGPEQVDGVGNFYLQVLATYPSQLPLSTLYFLDSHGEMLDKFFRSHRYKPIQKSQIDWFSNTSQALRGKREHDNSNNNLHVSLVFQHIPLPEYRDRHLDIHYGHQGERPTPPRSNTHFYDALVKEGVSAMSCGHDHVNDFCGLMSQDAFRKKNKNFGPGPWLCYGGAAGFGGYASHGKKRFHRRMRVWEIAPSTGSLKTWQRVEYATNRTEERVLVENGQMVLPL